MSLEWMKGLLGAPGMVGGAHLRPMTLGHVATLRNLRNKYLLGGVPTFMDLAVGVAVCKLSWPELREWLVGDDMRELKTWSRKTHKNWQKHGDAFSAWVGDNMTGPARWVEEGGKYKQLKAPWEWHLARILCKDWGMTFDQAWDTPVARARCCWDVTAEAHGDESLVSESEEEKIERAKAS